MRPAGAPTKKPPPYNLFGGGFLYRFIPLRLCVPHILVERTDGQQFLVLSNSNNFPLIHHNHAISNSDTTKAMGDNDRHFVSRHFHEALINQTFFQRINGSGRFV
jgi:hypothetical protein